MLMFTLSWMYGKMIDVIVQKTKSTTNLETLTLHISTGPEMETSS